MGVEVVSLVFGTLFAGVVTLMVSGVELRIWFWVFVTINGDKNESCPASWVCFGYCLCFWYCCYNRLCTFYNGDVLHLFSLVGVVF